MTGDSEKMEMVNMVAIGILGTLFVLSLVALIIVCSRRYCRQKKLRQLQKDEWPDDQLVDNMEGQTDITDVELDDVGINIDQILADPSWIDDATGLAPHCIEILKTCHHLTEKLVGMTMNKAQQLSSPETLVDIVAISKRLSPRVDDVVRAMYPPLDPRLLEARCAALVLSVSHLVLATKNACHHSGALDWIDQSLADVEDHLKVLREASVLYENALARASQLSSSTTVFDGAQQPLMNNPDLMMANQNPPQPSVQGGPAPQHLEASAL